MAAIVIGSCPIRGGIVAVGGEVRDALSVVVGFAESVLDLAGKIFARLATEGEFESVGFLVAVGLDLAILAEGGVGPVAESRKKRGVGIEGAKQGNPAGTDVACAESAFGGDLALDSQAVLQAVGNMQAWIEGDDTGGSVGNLG